MSLFRRVMNRLGYERRADGDNYWECFNALRSGAVSPARAQSISAVYACVAAISETIASLPLVLYRREGEDGRERAGDHPLYRVLHDLGGLAGKGPARAGRHRHGDARRGATGRELGLQFTH